MTFAGSSPWRAKKSLLAELLPQLSPQLFQPVVERCAPSARDDAHFVAHTERIGDGIAVLGIVFSDEIPIDQGHDSPVGHYAVHVENERFGLYDVFFEVSHIS